MAEDSRVKNAPRGGGAGRWVFLGFALIAGILLLAEHRAHVVEFLPFALLVACVLLHMFHGHGGHGGHGGGEKRDKTDERTGA